MEELGELLTPDELEGLSKDRVKTATWRLWMRQHRLPSINLGRRVFVRKADFAAFMASHMRGGEAQNGAGHFATAVVKPVSKSAARRSKKKSGRSR